jgi:CRISPR-associated endonuclease/helicase Cas3
MRSYLEVWKDLNRKRLEEKIIKPVYVFEQGSEKDKYIYKNQ